MDSKHLRSFLHISELGSISKAAERLNLTQPALSRQLKILEEEAGMRLLQRTGRGVSLTDAGRLLAQRAQSVISELEKISSELAAIKGTVRGELCIGFPPSVGLRLAGPVVQRFHSEYPDVQLRVEQLISGTLEQKLLAGRIDLGVLFDGTISPNLRTEPLWQEQLAVIAHPQIGLDAYSSLSLKQALQLPLILPKAPHNLRDMLEQQAFREGIPLNVEIEVDSLMIQLALVRRNLGCSIMPAALCQTELLADMLTSTDIVDPELTRTALLAWSKDHPLTTAGHIMAEMVRACAADNKDGEIFS
ncbi:LysR family transcriptional regulator [Pontibacterium sp. N1Y112]|uniref:LysR family transcriptional regulator n=1 Tax=Pontibacterium sinense TaxID=2781979 RepID=A0A8J7FAK0_9GAMM|nr:LysR family transcriptional regulator [Pontibacterium sinense]MBE9398005.1 LysR family transcriptional regulator [Pontibacterium sinense]